MRRWFKGRLDPGATVMDKEEESDTLNPGQEAYSLTMLWDPGKAPERPRGLSDVL